MGVSKSAFAQAPFDLAGKEVNLMIPFGPGGGSNFHGRLYAAALEQTLPGKPRIVAKNVDGGGSIRGTNEFDKNAEADGLWILEISGSTLVNSIFKDPSINYNLVDYEAFLSSPSGSIVFGRSDHAGGLSEDPVANVKKFIATPPTIAVQTITSSDIGMLLSYDLLGIKPKVIWGIGLGESRAGIERNEFQMRHDTTASFAEEVKPLVEAGKVKLLFAMGFEQGGKIVRDPNVPDTPHFLEMYEAVHGKKLSGLEYDVWKSLFDTRVMGGKMLLLPPKTPAHIIEAYSKATAEGLKLPSMTDDKAKLIIGNYPQSVGADAKRILTSALTIKPEHMQWLREWAAKTHNQTIRG
ncbi:hypothetical protein IZ6_12730 [Terrihabitans soli]|uniref:Tricarboxylate transporter n=2 Tax=Terrihabitans soli TaxID=708113 RepID=A0A6S6QVL3_9HYPH|nr:hypothetical protein IZ6_12730 [Terrihabitans soli]